MPMRRLLLFAIGRLGDQRFLFPDTRFTAPLQRWYGWWWWLCVEEDAFFCRGRAMRALCIRLLLFFRKQTKPAIPPPAPRPWLGTRLIAFLASNLGH